MKTEYAHQLLNEKIKRNNLKKHILAVAGIMKALAEFLEKDSELFYIAGLLHDLDFEETEGRPELHGLKTVEMLQKAQETVSEEIKQAILAHNFENTRVLPESELDFALIASDAVSGLIVSCALVMPNKKLSEVAVESIEKKFKQTDFARNCSRERIVYCEKLGLQKEKFFEIALNALQKISTDLGL